MKPFKLLLDMMNRLEQTAVAEGATEAHCIITNHTDHFHVCVSYADKLGEGYSIQCGIGVGIVEELDTEEYFERLTLEMQQKVRELMAAEAECVTHPPDGHAAIAIVKPNGKERSH